MRTGYPSKPASQSQTKYPYYSSQPADSTSTSLPSIVSAKSSSLWKWSKERTTKTTKWGPTASMLTNWWLISNKTMLTDMNLKSTSHRTTNCNSKSTLIPQESTLKRISEIRNLIVLANHPSAAEDKEMLKARAERILPKKIKSNKHPLKMCRSQFLPNSNKCLL